MKAVCCNQSNGGYRKPCAQEPQRALHGMAYWPSCSLLVRSSCSGLPFPSPSPGTFHCRGTDHDTHFPDLTAARLEGCSFSASPPFAPSPHRTGSVCAPLVYCGWRPQAVCLLVCSPPLFALGQVGGWAGLEEPTARHPGDGASRPGQKYQFFQNCWGWGRGQFQGLLLGTLGSLFFVLLCLLETSPFSVRNF